MSKRYTGGVISSTVPTVNASGATGVFTLSQQTAKQSTNNWPPFKVEKSLRFSKVGGSWLNKTFASSGNKTKWTFSTWIKIGDLSPTIHLLGGESGSNQDEYTYIWISSNKISHVIGQIGTNPHYTTTTAVFRDPSAWYHIVSVFDSAQSTDTNRWRLWVNGVEQTMTGTIMSQNYSSAWINGANRHGIMGRLNYSAEQSDGYLSETYFIDGQALTPSSFGATDKDGNWSPIAYAGTYGTNGFYLNFKDASSAAAVTYDYSGNGNNWTPNGINVTTANTSYSSVIDVPSDQAGANTRANYATLNAVDPYPGTMANGNLTHYIGSNDFASSRSTIGMKGGKWYWEAKCETTLGSSVYMGIGMCSDSGYNAAGYPGQTNYGYAYDGRATKYSNGGTSSSYGATYTSGDIIGLAFDSDSGTLEYYKNGTSQGVAFTGIPTTETFYANHWVYTAQISYNFGQIPFAYTPPSGYKALNTYNLAEPTIKQPNKHFEATLYTGANSAQTITNAGGFQPSLIWFKSRNLAYYNTLEDDIRGAGTRLFSNLTDGESNDGILTSFNSNGFSLGNNSGEGINNAASNYVAWQWKGATSNTTNTSGTITSNVRVNQTAGFSVVSYTGNGTNGASVGHGLGATPAMIFIKNRNDSVSSYWCVYHKSAYVSAADPNVLYLNSTQAQTDDTNVWGAAPSFTSSIFKVGDYNGSNGNGKNLIAYCWSEIEGYSKFGSYTGNGSTDGPFLYFGFKPKFYMYKRTDSTSNWVIMDTSRDTYNASGLWLYPNLSNAQNDVRSTDTWDFLSNGLKVRSSGTAQNASGGTYIYAAFAEMPFKYARAR